MCVRTNPLGLGETAEVVRTELTYDDIQSLPNTFDRVNYCGNYGDPLLSKDLIKILRYFEGSDQLVHTNGSLRNEKFWKELAKIKNVRVIFGIDGSNTISHEKYRVNTSFEKILKNAKTFNDAGGHSVWQMILFKHNENEVEEAKLLASQYGFKTFETLTSRRFFGKKEFTYEYNGDIVTLQPSGALEEGEVNAVECKAQQLEEIYIDAQGYAHPCCYITKEKIKAPNIREVPFEDIIYDTYFDYVDANKNCIDTCKLTCGMKYRNKRIRSNVDPNISLLHLEDNQ
jgi:MoaA/NifB/PqqE/SkfB family radical SAM enzyme